MGFCYLNSIAIAAHYALAMGCERVAIWDLTLETLFSMKSSYALMSITTRPRIFPARTSSAAVLASDRGRV
jgi:hypothetical protein